MRAKGVLINMKNTKVRASKIPAGTSDLPIDDLTTGVLGETPKAQFVKMQGRLKRQYTKITDEIAQSDHWIRNEPIPFGLELFKVEQNLWYMRFADLCYPYSKGGKIYIDTPMSPIDVTYCKRKLEAYRAKGVRYTYIVANEGPEEALMRMHDVLPKGATA